MTAQRNYAPLDAAELVDPGYLGTGAGGGKFLKDDQTWDTPASGGSVATDAIWDAAGDLAVGTGANTAAKLTKGSDGQVLTVDPTTHLLVWATPTTGVTDHGALTGLGDDDHPQYATNTEFDDHNARHESGGGDAIKLDDLAAADDTTDLDSSNARHGLLKKLIDDTAKFLRSDGSWSIPSGTGAPTDADYLVGTAQAGLSAEIVVGATPGGELGGTWASPTVDATHSGSAHGDFVAKAFLDAKGDLISASADNTPVLVPVGANGTLLTADSAQAAGMKWQGAWADFTPTWSTDGTAPSLGNGSLVGRYLRIGPIIFFHIAFVAGSTTTFGTGNWIFALPATSSNTTRGHVYGVALDSSAGTRDGVNGMYEPNAAATLRLTPDSANAITNTAPWTWATSDELSLSGWMEV